MQMLVDETLHAMQSRADRIFGHEPRENVRIQALIGNQGTMHVGRLLGKLAPLQLRVCMDAHCGAVLCPGDHAPQVVGIAASGRLPQIDRKTHDEDLVDPVAEMLAEAHGVLAATALVVEHDPLAKIAAEHAEAVGKGLDRVLASGSVAAKLRNRPEWAASGW